MSRLDHVIIAVKDADVTCKLLLDHLGLASYAAGRIIGASNAYRELRAIMDVSKLAQ